MTDANLSTSQSAILTRILSLVTNASVDELYKISRTGTYIGEEENTTLEQAINTRVGTLAVNATTSDLSKLGRTVSLMMSKSITITQGEIIPSQNGSDGTFLSTDGSNDDWNGLITKNVLEIDDTSPQNDQILLYDGTKFKPSDLAIKTVTLDTDLPTTGNTTGDLYYSNESSKIHYWDGSAWQGIGA